MHPCLPGLQRSKLRTKWWRLGAGVYFLTLATPVGWVGLIVTAAAVSMLSNSVTKKNAGDVYDSIMDG